MKLSIFTVTLTVAGRRCCWAISYKECLAHGDGYLMDRSIIEGNGDFLKTPE